MTAFELVAHCTLNDRHLVHCARCRFHQSSKTNRRDRRDVHSTHTHARTDRLPNDITVITIIILWLYLMCHIRSGSNILMRTANIARRLCRGAMKGFPNVAAAERQNAFVHSYKLLSFPVCHGRRRGGRRRRRCRFHRKCSTPAPIGRDVLPCNYSKHALHF